MRFPETIEALSAFEERIFAASRLRLTGCLGLALIAAMFAWAVASGQSVTTRAGTPSSADFSFIYASGLVAASPHSAAVYDYHAFAAAQAGLTGPRRDGLPYYHFLYPPIFLVLTGVLASLPFLAAAGVWIGGTFVLYIAALRAILPRGWLLLPATMLLAVLKNAQLGQNGFLTAGLCGLSLALVERQPVVAGVFLGLLTYKPQFGMLFPLALVAAGRWRVIASATATAGVIAAVATRAYGRAVWPAYIASLHGFNARLSPDLAVGFQYQSVFGWLQSHGVSPAEAMLAHLVVATLVAALVVAMWYGDAPLPLRAAALAAGSAAATPYVLTYDLGLLTIAMAFLIQDGLARGFLAGERLLLALCVALSFLLTAPIAPLLYGLLIGVAAWRWQVRPGGCALLAAQPAGGEYPASQRLAATDEAGRR